MYAVRRPVENVYLVRERDRRRSRELFGLALAALPPVAVLFAAIWANVKTVELGYQIEKLARSSGKRSSRRQRQLEMERAQVSSLARVRDVARGTLGLVPPTPTRSSLVRDAALAPAPPPARPRPPARRDGRAAGARPDGGGL